jgi:hypothetical protein
MIMGKELTLVGKEALMFDAKWIADFITAARATLGLVMIWLGVTLGEQTLPIVIPMIILCWSGDFFDGLIARRSRNPRKSFIGDHDVQIDMFVSICLALFMLFTKLVSASVGIWYFILLAIVFWRYGMDRNLLMLAQTPIYLYFILIGLRDFPALGYLMVFWVLLALAFHWQRFSQEVVPNFLKGMRSLWTHKH